MGIKDLNSIGIVVKPEQSAILINGHRINKVTAFSIEQLAHQVAIVTFSIVADTVELLSDTTEE